MRSKQNAKHPLAAGLRRQRTLARAWWALILLLVAGMWPGLAQAQEAKEAVIRFVRNPDPAPEFTLKSLGGAAISLADYRGKVVFLNFWATWCGPCRAEVPDLVVLQEHYKDKLQIIGLDVDDDDAAEIQKYVEENGIQYPVAMTPGELRAEYGGIPALPTSFLLDTEGRVVQKHVGLWDPSLYETEIRALLGLPIAARVETFEDRGEVFLRHADRATDLPGVDLSKLTAEQKKSALHQFNAEACSCGCQYTLAQCRIWDSACPVSKVATEKIVDTLLGNGNSPAADRLKNPAGTGAPATSVSPIKPSGVASPGSKGTPSAKPEKPSATAEFSPR